MQWRNPGVLFAFSCLAIYTNLMPLYIAASVFAILLISSLTFIPSFMLDVDKTTLGYKILLVVFNPVFDGIGLLLSILPLVFSRKS
jgi:hypothetical protein